MLTQLIALLAIFAAQVGMSLIAMIFGWGLWPKNWWVVIGVGVFGTLFAHLVASKVIKECGKK